MSQHTLRNFVKEICVSLSRFVESFHPALLNARFLTKMTLELGYGAKLVWIHP